MEKRRGARQFILIGFCSSVDAAHIVSVEDERVVGIAYLEGYAFRTRGFWLRYLLRLVDPPRIKRFLKGALPDVFARGDSKAMRVGVDRQGNILAVWTSQRRYGPNGWAGQWFDHSGTPGAVFQAATAAFLDKFFERVASGLFLAGFTVSGEREWLGQFDALATSMSPPPAWLASKPDKTLHMVRGGGGYAVLPKPGASPTCEEQIEVVSPSGQSCGVASFAMGGGACTTQSIIVGYDGTVVQQAPRDRETCTTNDHLCTCTYRYWPGFFR